MIVDQKSEMGVDKALAPEEETSEEKPRVKTEFEDPEQRIGDFREVEKGFTEQDARRESVRCLRCDLEQERG